MQDSFLERALGLAGGVGQGEDDGSVVQLGHVLENLLCESTANRGQAHQDRGLDIVNQTSKRLVLTAIVVVSREVDLVLCQFVSPILGDKTIGVDEPEFATGLFLGQAFLDEELDNLLRNTSSSAASTEEDGFVVLDGHTRRLDSVDEATDNDGASALDVVVEHGVGVLVAFDGREGVFEVLELDDNAVTRSVSE